jgi:hypothetical protein
MISLTKERTMEEVEVTSVEMFDSIVEEAPQRELDGFFGSEDRPTVTRRELVTFGHGYWPHTVLEHKGEYLTHCGYFDGKWNELV